MPTGLAERQWVVGHGSRVVACKGLDRSLRGNPPGRSSCGEGPLPSLSPYGEGSQCSAPARWTWTPRHTGSERGEAPRRTRTGPPPLRLRCPPAAVVGAVG